MNERWSSRAMFILAAIGSAVGLGNIWRFSYMAGEYGGGSFIILYLLSVLLIGLPIMILEFTAGKFFSAPLSQSFAKIGKGLLPASLIPHAFNLLVLSYYIVVTGWTLAYLVYSIAGTYVPFSQFSQQPFFLLFAPLSLALMFAIMRSGLREGVEKANAILMPLFFLILASLFLYSLTLPGLPQALSFYSSFGNITVSTATAAVTQTLFSLSVGAGIMLTYASHLRKKERIASSAAIISLTDTAVALAAGIAIFPIVFTYGLDPASGPQLAFDTLPIAFAQMPFGNVIMPLFFLLLFSAAMTSAVSMAEVMVADLSRKTERKTAALYATILVALAAIPSFLSHSFMNLEFAGMPVLDFLDGKVVVAIAPLGALVMVLVLGWGWKDMESEIRKTLPGMLVAPYILLIRFIVPLVLAAMFASALSG